MRRLGYTEPAQLARRLGLTAYSSPRRVKRWLNGENEPEFEETIKLLDALGAINWEVLRSDRPLSAEGVAGAEVAAAEELKRLRRRARREPREAER